MKNKTICQGFFYFLNFFFFYNNVFGKNRIVQVQYTHQTFNSKWLLARAAEYTDCISAEG